jgi:DNA-binding response OmpR family regulator
MTDAKAVKTRNTELWKPASASKARHKKVLVVDDVRSSADAFASIILEYGYAAIPVYDGADAVKHAWALRPQLAIVNVNMAEKDGVETAVEIWDEVPNCKILFMSGYPLESVAERVRLTARKPGKDYELTEKPIRIEDFLAKVGKLLGEKGR